MSFNSNNKDITFGQKRKIVKAKQKWGNPISQFVADILDSFSHSKSLTGQEKEVSYVKYDSNYYPKPAPKKSFFDRIMD